MRAAHTPIFTVLVCDFEMFCPGDTLRSHQCRGGSLGPNTIDPIIMLFYTFATRDCGRRHCFLAVRPPRSPVRLSCQILLPRWHPRRRWVQFLPPRRYDSAVLAVIMCPSVRLSVCLSHAGIVPKQLNLESRKQRRTIV